MTCVFIMAGAASAEMLKPAFTNGHGPGDGARRTFVHHADGVIPDGKLAFLPLETFLANNNAVLGPGPTPAFLQNNPTELTRQTPHEQARAIHPYTEMLNNLLGVIGNGGRMKIKPLSYHRLKIAGGIELHADPAEAGAMEGPSINITTVPMMEDDKVNVRDVQVKVSWKDKDITEEVEFVAPYNGITTKRRDGDDIRLSYRKQTGDDPAEELKDRFAMDVAEQLIDRVVGIPKDRIKRIFNHRVQQYPKVRTVDLSEEAALFDHHELTTGKRIASSPDELDTPVNLKLVDNVVNRTHKPDRSPADDPTPVVREILEGIKERDPETGKFDTNTVGVMIYDASSVDAHLAGTSKPKPVELRAPDSLSIKSSEVDMIIHTGVELDLSSQRSFAVVGKNLFELRRRQEFVYAGDGDSRVLQRNADKSPVVNNVYELHPTEGADADIITRRARLATAHHLAAHQLSVAT